MLCKPLLQSEGLEGEIATNPGNSLLMFSPFIINKKQLIVDEIYSVVVYVLTKLYK